MGGQLGCRIYMLRRLIGGYLGMGTNGRRLESNYVDDPLSIFNFKGKSYQQCISPVLQN